VGHCESIAAVGRLPSIDSDTNGNFVIPNVPAGKYTLRALHRKAQSTNEISRAVRVNRSGISLVNFTLDAPAR
jgi:hypothetical protein